MLGETGSSTDTHPCGCRQSQTKRDERIQGKHRYGTFVVLRPDAESIRRLSEISSKVNELFSPGVFKPNKEQDLHITLVSPLKAMSQQEAENYMRTIKQETDRSVFSTPSQKLMTHKLRLYPDRSGNYMFQFAAPDGNPYVILKVLQERPKKGSPARLLQCPDTLAEKAKQIALSTGLVQPDKKIKTFSPHVTLGRLSGYEQAISAHKRDRHPESSQKSTGFALGDQVAAKICDTFELHFPILELLQIDRMPGETIQGYATIARLNLRTGKFETFIPPACRHQQSISDKPISAEAGPSTSAVLDTQTVAVDRAFLPPHYRFSSIAPMTNPRLRVEQTDKGLIYNPLEVVQFFLNEKFGEDAIDSFYFKNNQLIIEFASQEKALEYARDMGFGLSNERRTLKLDKQGCQLVLGDELGTLFYTASALNIDLHLNDKAIHYGLVLAP